MTIEIKPNLTLFLNISNLKNKLNPIKIYSKTTEKQQQLGSPRVGA
jgi:hypothetical protein